jgi:hypothetical protein
MTMTLRLTNAARVFLAACSLSLFAACASTDDANEPPAVDDAVEAGALPDSSLAPTGTCIQNCIKRLDSCLAQGTVPEEECFSRNDNCMAACQGVAF